MVVIKEYCDRCGKELSSGPLDHKLFPIFYKCAKNQIRFRDKISYTETNKMICEECLKEFLEWWKIKEVKENASKI